MDSSDYYLKDNWLILMGKTRHWPLLVGVPRVKSSYRATTLMPCLSSYIGALLACGFGSLMLYLAISHPEGVTSKLAMVILLLLGTFFFVVGPLTLLKHTTVSWENNASKLVIRYGWRFLPKIVALNCNEVEVNLSLAPKPSSWFSLFMQGWTVLSLCKSGHEGKVINIACCPNKESLMPVFKKLEEFLGSKVIDETLVKITAPNGKTLIVSRVPINKTCSTFKTMTLIINSESEVAVIRPTICIRLFFLQVLGFGLFSLYMIPTFRQDTSSVCPLLLVGGVGVVFMIVGIVGLFMGIGIQHVRADRRRESISIKEGIFGMHPRDSLYRFDDIVAIQVCSKYVDLGEGGGGATYELDMVFYGFPQAIRRSILSYSDKNQVLSDAQKFADFLDKPLFDHTEAI